MSNLNEKIKCKKTELQKCKKTEFIEKVIENKGKIRCGKHCGKCE